MTAPEKSAEEVARDRRPFLLEALERIEEMCPPIPDAVPEDLQRVWYAQSTLWTIDVRTLVAEYHEERTAREAAEAALASARAAGFREGVASVQSIDWRARLLARLNASIAEAGTMTAEAAKAALVAGGYLTADGQLAPEYGGALLPDEARPVKNPAEF